MKHLLFDQLVNIYSAALQLKEHSLQHTICLKRKAFHMLKEPILKILNKTYQPDTMIELESKRYDLRTTMIIFNILFLITVSKIKSRLKSFS